MDNKLIEDNIVNKKKLITNKDNSFNKIRLLKNEFALYEKENEIEMKFNESQVKEKKKIF